MTEREKIDPNFRPFFLSGICQWRRRKRRRDYLFLVVSLLLLLLLPGFRIRKDIFSTSAAGKSTSRENISKLFFHRRRIRETVIADGAEKIKKGISPHTSMDLLASSSLSWAAFFLSNHAHWVFWVQQPAFCQER